MSGNTTQRGIFFLSLLPVYYESLNHSLSHYLLACIHSVSPNKAINVRVEVTSGCQLLFCSFLNFSRRLNGTPAFTMSLLKEAWHTMGLECQPVPVSVHFLECRYTRLAVKWVPLACCYRHYCASLSKRLSLPLDSNDI